MSKQEGGSFNPVLSGEWGNRMKEELKKKEALKEDALKTPEKTLDVKETLKAPEKTLDVKEALKILEKSLNYENVKDLEIDMKSRHIPGTRTTHFRAQIRGEIKGIDFSLEAKGSDSTTYLRRDPHSRLEYDFFLGRVGNQNISSEEAEDLFMLCKKLLRTDYI